MTTPPDIPALIAAAREHDARATPEPWHCNNGVGYVYGPDCVVAVCGDFRDRELVPFNGDRWNADARLIAFARSALRPLADEAARLREENARLRLFAQHDDDCGQWTGEGNDIDVRAPCTCGRDAALSPPQDEAAGQEDGR